MKMANGMTEGKSTRRILVPQAGILPIYRPHLCARQRRQLFFGGAGSGKSVFLASRAVLDALTGRNTLIVRQVARTLRHSCFNEVTKAMAMFQLTPAFVLNKSEMSLTCRLSGAQLLFLGLDDSEKIKSLTPRSGVLTDIWVEEATECRYQDVKQLEKRLRGQSPHPKRISLSFNPVHKGHWLYKEYFGSWQPGQRQQIDQDLLILHSSYLDNPFLTADDRQAYQGEADRYFHQVYTLGEWGELAGGIYQNWRTGSLPASEIRQKSIRCGLDFGFAKDPAVAIKLQLSPDGRRIHVLEELYLHGLSNEVLAQRLRPFLQGLPLICDSAEPKSIAELRRHGIAAFPARKGPDSLRHGIAWLKAREIIVAESCQHTMAEQHNYRWRQDGAGSALPQPEGEDHLLDAMRYALEGDMQQRYAQAAGKVR